MYISCKIIYYTRLKSSCFCCGLQARIALQQFHTTDRASRKQSFHLEKLEPRKPGETRTAYPQTAVRDVSIICQLFGHVSYFGYFKMCYKLYESNRMIIHTIIYIIIKLPCTHIHLFQFILVSVNY